MVPNCMASICMVPNGKVVLVGDPVSNPPLWELYKTTITQLIENGGTMPELQE